MTQLFPGDVGFSKITGLTGLFVRFGQFIVGDDSPFTHVFVVTNTNPGLVLEAMPNGMRTRVFTGAEVGVAYARLPLSDEQRRMVPLVSKQFENVKYGFSAYLYLFLNRFGGAPARLKRYIETNGRMICSQTADEFLRRLNYHVFNDGRMPHDVTPGDLFNELALQGRIFRAEA